MVTIGDMSARLEPGLVETRLYFPREAHIEDWKWWKARDGRSCRDVVTTGGDSSKLLQGGRLKTFESVVSRPAGDAPAVVNLQLPERLTFQRHFLTLSAPAEM